MIYPVIIIGGGVIGCNIAYELAERGIKALVLEKNKTLLKNTSRAALGILRYNLSTDRPKEWHSLASQGLKYHKRLESLLTRHVNTSWHWDGKLEIARSNENNIKKIYEIEYQNKQNVTWLTPEAVYAKTGITNHHGYVNNDEGWVNPIEFHQALFLASKKLNAEFRFGAFVKKIEPKLKHHIIYLKDGTQLKCHHLILATGHATKNLNINNIVKPAIIPVKGQSIFLKDIKMKFKEVLCLEKFLCVPHANGLHVGATIEENETSRFSTLAVTSLLHELLLLFPELKNYPLTKLKFIVGFRPKSEDLIPLVKEDERTPTLYWALGHYDKGIFLAPVTAFQLANQITK